MLVADIVGRMLMLTDRAGLQFVGGLVSVMAMLWGAVSIGRRISRWHNRHTP